MRHNYLSIPRSTGKSVKFKKNVTWPTHGSTENQLLTSFQPTVNTHIDQVVIGNISGHCQWVPKVHMIYKSIPPIIITDYSLPKSCYFTSSLSCFHATWPITVSSPCFSIFAGNSLCVTWRKEGLTTACFYWPTQGLQRFRDGETYFALRGLGGGYKWTPEVPTWRGVEDISKIISLCIFAWNTWRGG